jgi:hypothetical protein
VHRWALLWKSLSQIAGTSHGRFVEEEHSFGLLWLHIVLGELEEGSAHFLGVFAAAPGLALLPYFFAR